MSACVQYAFNKKILYPTPPSPLTGSNSGHRSIYKMKNRPAETKGWKSIDDSEAWNEDYENGFFWTAGIN